MFHGLFFHGHAQAFIPRPGSSGELAIKTVFSLFVLLGLSLYLALQRPYTEGTDLLQLASGERGLTPLYYHPAGHRWKLPVRLCLLLLGASCVAMNASLSAIDLG
jgi:hypothetical protein